MDDEQNSELTPSSLSKTKLSSMAPIHSRDPINEGSLSPISTSDCCISLKRCSSQPPNLEHFYNLEQIYIYIGVGSNENDIYLKEHENKQNHICFAYKIIHDSRDFAICSQSHSHSLFQNLMQNHVWFLLVLIFF